MSGERRSHAKTFMPTIKKRGRLAALQLKGLKWTVKHAYNGSAFYRRKFEEAGVTPGAIKTLDDIRRLPFTTATTSRAGYPFPLLSVPFEKVVRIHASSGTTGKRKVLCYSAKDIDDWANIFARCYEMAGLHGRTGFRSRWVTDSGLRGGVSGRGRALWCHGRYPSVPGISICKPSSSMIFRPRSFAALRRWAS